LDLLDRRLQSAAQLADTQLEFVLAYASVVVTIRLHAQVALGPRIRGTRLGLFESCGATMLRTAADGFKGSTGRNGRYIGCNERKLMLDRAVILSRVLGLWLDEIYARQLVEQLIGARASPQRQRGRDGKKLAIRTESKRP
jgi:hypothetical protein